MEKQAHDDHSDPPLRRILKMHIPLVLLPPWRGKVGMGGRLGASLRALRLSFTPTLALPVKGEGIEEVESLPEIA